MPLNASPRVSLACLQCRERHVRCDAVTPACTRCLRKSTPCSYSKSRRGGRSKKHETQPSINHDDTPVVLSPNDFFTDFDFGMPSLEEEQLWHLRKIPSPPSGTPLHQGLAAAEGAEYEMLIGLYYDNFHRAHPCILPQTHFRAIKAQDPELVRLLEPVMCWIGSMYASRPISNVHEERARNAVDTAQSQPPTAFGVQALLLFSIATYWNNDIEKGHAILDSTICMALGLGLHRRDFARIHGKGDAVLEESWRRTWWQIYITDLHLAASSHASTWRTSDIESTVDLPCEEHEYESGCVSQPRTLDEYENREFGQQCAEFSSFAQVVGLARCLDLTLAGASRADMVSLSRIAQEADAAVAAWSLLLPESKRQLVRTDGTVDEMLFKANMLLNAYIVDVHRPLSSLAYSTIESCSRCAPPAPSQHSSPARALQARIHTTKILQAIERLTELLTLPTQLTKHSPFLICIVAITTIAHLSACRYVLSGRDWKIARQRIRAAMGALKAYGDIWPLGKRTYREVGNVAREILDLNGPGSLESQQAVRSTIDFSTTPHCSSVLPDYLDFLKSPLGFSGPP